MTKIEIDTDLADHVAGRLIHDGGDVRRIMAGLEKDVDALVPDGEVRASVQEILSDALVRGQRAAEGWEALGERLRRVSEGFREADYAGLIPLLGLGAWAAALEGSGIVLTDALREQALRALWAGDEPPGPADALLEMLAGTTEENLNAFLDAVHGATVDVRQEVLQAIIEDKGKLPADLEPSLRTLCVAALLEGALYWPGGSGPNLENDWQIDDHYAVYAYDDNGNPVLDEKGQHKVDHYVDNDFAAWLRADHASEAEARAHMPDPRMGRMNCWEYVCYSAFISGQASYEALNALHDTAAEAARGIWEPAWRAEWERADAAGEEPDYAAAYFRARGAYYDVLAEGFGVETAVNLDAIQSQGVRAVPPAGSLVFLDDLAHVTLSVGRMDEENHVEVLSLWKFPPDWLGKPVHTAQRTTIPAMRDGYKEHVESEGGKAPWLDATYGRNPIGELGE